MQYFALKLLPVALFLLSTLVPLLAQPQTPSLDKRQGSIVPSKAGLEDVLLTRIRRWLWGGSKDDNETTPVPAEVEEEDLVVATISTTAKPSMWKKWWAGFKAVANRVGSAVKEEAGDVKDALMVGARTVKVKLRRGYNKTKKGFRIVKLSVKKGFNITKETLKAAVRKVKRLFTKEEKFSIFANNLKDKVEAGDVEAIKFLEKLGIGLAFEDGKINSASIVEEVNVTEVLNKEGLAKPPTAEVEEEEEGGKGGEEVDAEEGEVSDKEELVEEPDTWRDAVECSVTCELNKTEETSEEGVDDGHVEVPVATSEDPVPAEFHAVHTTELPGHTTSSLSTTLPTTTATSTTTSTISSTTIPPLSTTSTPIASTPSVAIALPTTTTTTSTLTATTTPSLTTTTSASTTSATTTTTMPATPTSTATTAPATTTPTTTTPTTTTPTTTTPTTTTSSTTTTVPTTTTTTTVPTTTTPSTTTEAIVPTTTTSTSTTTPSTTTTTTTIPSTLPPYYYYYDGDDSEIFYESSVEDLRSTAGEEPPPFPDIFSDERVKNRLEELYEHGDLTHESLHDIFNFDPSNYEEYYYDTTLSE